MTDKKCVHYWVCDNGGDVVKAVCRHCGAETEMCNNLFSRVRFNNYNSNMAGGIKTATKKRLLKEKRAMEGVEWGQLSF